MTDFLIAALAVYGLAYTIARMDGPFDLFAKLRYLAIKQDTWYKRGIYCPICVSFWLSWLATSALDYQDYVHYVILSLALMGCTIVLTLILER